MHYETLKNNRIIRHIYYLSGVIKRKKYYEYAKRMLEKFGISFADENKTKAIGKRTCFGCS